MSEHKFKPGDVVTVTGEWEVIGTNTPFRWVNVRRGDKRGLCVGFDDLALVRASKPEEPTGLGAVVEDVDGVPWVRTENRANITGAVWQSAFHVTQPDKAIQREYADIAAVRVLSEGVPA